MKTRLNITIEESLLDNVKNYASRNNVSVSELVENYLKKLIRPAKKKSIIDAVAKLKKPNIDPSIDLKELYYKENAKKYGF
ncbi:DUF6364 family protein [Chitinophagaceae bacterium 26-R-25]|nr:DUF6364 family protein [Chitinophagaceae bacterium 26-R-25]